MVSRLHTLRLLCDRGGGEAGLEYLLSVWQLFVSNLVGLFFVFALSDCFVDGGREGETPQGVLDARSRL